MPSREAFFDEDERASGGERHPDDFGKKDVRQESLVAVEALWAFCPIPKRDNDLTRSSGWQEP